jgi:guanylate kinase
VHGVDYYFFSAAEFDAALESGEFLEWAEVHGKRYGTRLGSVREAARGGRGVLLVIDVQGAEQVRERLARTHSVFLLPPSEEALVERIRGRQSETEESLRRRLESARGEIPRSRLYDFCVVNEDLDRTVSLLGNHLMGLLGLENRSS